MTDVVNGIAIGVGFALPLTLLYTVAERAKAYGRGYVEGVQAASEAAFRLASADTHPEGGDAKQAPFMGSAVAAKRTDAQPSPKRE